MFDFTRHMDQTTTVWLVLDFILLTILLTVVWMMFRWIWNQEI